MNTVAKLRLSTRHMPGISIDVVSEGSVLFMLAARAGSVMLVGRAGPVMLAAVAQAIVLVADDARPPPAIIGAAKITAVANGDIQTPYTLSRHYCNRVVHTRA